MMNNSCYAQSVVGSSTTMPTSTEAEQTHGGASVAVEFPTRIPYEDAKYKWDYDDMGVVCRFDKEAEEWEVMESCCHDCGHLHDECDCDTDSESSEESSDSESSEESSDSESSEESSDSESSEESEDEEEVCDICGKHEKDLCSVDDHDMNALSYCEACLDAYNEAYDYGEMGECEYCKNPEPMPAACLEEVGGYLACPTCSLGIQRAEDGLCVHCGGEEEEDEEGDSVCVDRCVGWWEFTDTKAMEKEIARLTAKVAVMEKEVAKWGV